MGKAIVVNNKMQKNYCKQHYIGVMTLENI